MKQDHSKGKQNAGEMHLQSLLMIQVCWDRETQTNCSYIYADVLLSMAMIVLITSNFYFTIYQLVIKKINKTFYSKYERT